EPLACIRRSGITSRTKFASFSFSHKSWASSGPRAPAVKLFWLSVTGAPKAVVRWETGHFLGSWLIVFLQEEQQGGSRSRYGISTLRLTVLFIQTYSIAISVHLSFANTFIFHEN